MSPKRAALLNHIRELRFAADQMTQAEPAARLGVTRQTVIAIERRQYSPSVEMPFRIAQILGVPLETAFEFEGDEAAGPDPSQSGDPRRAATDAPPG